MLENDTSRRIVHDERPRITIARAAQLTNTTSAQIWKYAIPGNLFEFDKACNGYMMFKADLPDLVELLKSKAPSDARVVLEGAEMITLSQVAERFECEPAHLYNLRAQGKWPKEYQGFLTIVGGNGMGRQRRQVLKFDAGVVNALKELKENPTPKKEKPVPQVSNYLTPRQISEQVPCELYEVYHLKSYGGWPEAFPPMMKGLRCYYKQGVVEAVREVMKQGTLYQNRVRTTEKKPSPYRDQGVELPAPVVRLKTKEPVAPQPVAIVTKSGVAYSELKDLAIELIQAGFTDAGVYLLQKKA